MECSICQEAGITNANGGRIGACNHCFHNNCIKKWFSKNKDTCPNCRCHVDLEKLVFRAPGYQDRAVLHKLRSQSRKIIRMFDTIDAYLDDTWTPQRQNSLPESQNFIDEFVENMRSSREVLERYITRSRDVSTVVAQALEDPTPTTTPTTENDIETTFLASISPPPQIIDLT
jgi:hypothetical protein